MCPSKDWNNWPSPRIRTEVQEKFKQIFAIQHAIFFAQSCMVLRVIAQSCMLLRVYECCFTLLHVNIRFCNLLHDVAGCWRMLHGVA